MTYLRAFSMVVLVATAAVVMGALAVSTASAPPARGDPPITEGAGGGTGTGGGADPPGGITDAPPPEVPNTDGSWTATVGGTEFAGLTEADVGRVLWRGENVIETYEDDAGLTQTRELCEEFPRIELRSAHPLGETLKQSITIRMDYTGCTATLSNIHTTSTTESGPLEPSETAWSIFPLFGAPHATGSNISWTGGIDAFERYAAVPLDCRDHPSGSSRWSEYKGVLWALDGVSLFGFRIGNRLTETKLTRCYSATPSLATADAVAACRGWRPSGVIRWRVDDCAVRTRDSAGSVLATADGRFRAETTPPFGTVNMPTNHRISLRLEGASTDRDEIKTCVIDPPSIEDLRATFFGPNPLFPIGPPLVILRFGVDFNCEYSDRVFR